MPLKLYKFTLTLPWFLVTRPAAGDSFHASYTMYRVPKSINLMDPSLCLSVLNYLLRSLRVSNFLRSVPLSLSLSCMIALFVAQRAYLGAVLCLFNFYSTGGIRCTQKCMHRTTLRVTRVNAERIKEPRSLRLVSAPTDLID